MTLHRMLAATVLLGASPAFADVQAIRAPLQTGAAVPAQSAAAQRAAAEHRAAVSSEGARDNHGAAAAQDAHAATQAHPPASNATHAQTGGH